LLVIATAGEAAAQAQPTPEPLPLPGAPSSLALPRPIADAPLFPAEPAPSTPTVAGIDGQPLAGYHGGVFYLRDKQDNFRLYVGGRAQVDFYGFFGPGVADTTLKSTLLLRRIRPELSGELFKRVAFQISGDFGTTGVSDFEGTNELRAAAPGETPTVSTARYGSAQGVAVRAGPTDVFLNARICDCLNVQLGQFNAPFTMENRTSDNSTPFMERSLAVRVLGIPSNKELGAMAWGNPFGWLGYEVGVFMGDGQNRPNIDNRFDTMGRAYVRPLASQRGPLRDLQVGGSVRYGQRDPDYVNYDVVNATTQGGATFWRSVYRGDGGYIHVIPSGAQLGLAGELRIPFDRVDLTGEFVYINNDTREAFEGFQAKNTERLGGFEGFAYYAQVGYWPFGSAYVNGRPGDMRPTHVDLSRPDSPPKLGLQLLVRWQQLRVRYESAGRAGIVNPQNIDGKIKVDALSLGANFWATKHLRFTVNYVLDMFPGSAPLSPSDPSGPKQSAKQRAVAPGNTQTSNPSARDTAHSLHELLFRAGVSF
jgi:phosphate-selective porin